MDQDLSPFLLSDVMLWLPQEAVFPASDPEADAHCWALLTHPPQYA
jgi:hypothetical protein